ncbi:EAL domain-containing protein, partial [Klebsiella michiganensis]|uniref:EAL domain-containing protein n=1 Tax=Klebsiella michiganensis TaxID=1134687 RepID=UPI0029286113
AHDVPLGCAPDEYDDLISGTCSHLPKIKIDRSFVINIPDQKDDLDIVRLIISMGKSLHMRIVAEGVETEEQLQSLRKLGCDLVQGYLIGKPGPLNSPDNR